jgi:hypothetical protein
MTKQDRVNVVLGMLIDHLKIVDSEWPDDKTLHLIADIELALDNYNEPDEVVEDSDGDD